MPAFGIDLSVNESLPRNEQCGALVHHAPPWHQHAGPGKCPFRGTPMFSVVVQRLREIGRTLNCASRRQPRRDCDAPAFPISHQTCTTMTRTILPLIASIVMRSLTMGTAVLCANARAQAPAGVSRVEVNAETRPAAKAGQLIPAGEGQRPAAPQPPSTKTRRQRQADTLREIRNGDLSPAGEGEDKNVAHAARESTSTWTRAQRKAETLEAARKHRLTLTGKPDVPRSK